MTPDRRTFLRLSALAGGSLAVGAWRIGAPGASAQDASAQGTEPTPAGGSLPGRPPASPAPRSLRLLILGGTGFTGPSQVEYAVARGHQVTVFNRGRSEADLPAGVEQLLGDRNTGEVQALQGREWDAVIDNPTTLPFWVRDAADVLQGNVGQYVFISTLSVYDLAGLSQVDEESPVLEYRDGDPLEVTPERYQEVGGALYGPMKAASEREGRRRFGEDRTTIIRPGLIVGPRDASDRFTYWPVRIARGGEVLAPGDGEDAVQVVDARDLAQWTIRMVESGTTGVFNATGPRARLTMAEQLHGIRAALPGDIPDLRFTWVPAEFLQEQEVRAWSEMTTWFGPRRAISETRIDRAVDAGLTFRPLATTAADTLAWFRSLPAERQAEPRAGLASEKEQAVLEAWRRAGAASLR
jgi:2'-hydroxyisoflavone reductase